VNVSLNSADAVELADFLRFLDEWLTSDREQLGDSLARFMGTHPYGIDLLRHDLARFSACSAPETTTAPSETRVPASRLSGPGASQPQPAPRRPARPG